MFHRGRWRQVFVSIRLRGRADGVELLDSTTQGGDHHEGISSDRMTGEWDIYLEKRRKECQYLGTCATSMSGKNLHLGP